MPPFREATEVNGEQRMEERYSLFAIPYSPNYLNTDQQ
jgi:hypothetical protein